MSGMVTCPVCSTKNPPRSMRCGACAADFSDPDVMAMAGIETQLPTDVTGGSLSHSKFLGFAQEALESGATVPKLAILAAGFLTVGFLVPIPINMGSSEMAWKALDYGSTFAILLPAISALIAIAGGFAPIPAWQRSSVLVVVGMIGLVSLPLLGRFTGAPEATLPVLRIGLVIAAWGLVFRCLYPQSPEARYVLVAGTVITLVGYFIPTSQGFEVLPLEVQAYLREEMPDASPFAVLKKVFNRDPLVFFTTIYLLAPLVLAPVAAAIAWKTPKEAWDRGGALVRPLAWFFVLYVPLGFALLAFNLMGEAPKGKYVGFHERWIPMKDFFSAGITGRFRSLLLGAGYTLLATLPAVSIFAHVKERLGRKTQAAPQEDASASTPPS